VLVHDVASGALLRNFQNLHAGEACALEGCHSGRLLFTGGQDGLVIAHDLRIKVGAALAATLRQQQQPEARRSLDEQGVARRRPAATGWRHPP
jgi:hypothetical protein